MLRKEQNLNLIYSMKRTRQGAKTMLGTLQASFLWQREIRKLQEVAKLDLVQEGEKVYSHSNTLDLDSSSDEEVKKADSPPRTLLLTPQASLLQSNPPTHPKTHTQISPQTITNQGRPSANPIERKFYPPRPHIFLVKRTQTGYPPSKRAPKQHPQPSRLFLSKAITQIPTMMPPSTTWLKNLMTRVPIFLKSILSPEENSPR